MPKIWGVRLTGALPPWVSAKDVILEMLRRHGVKGGVGRIIEYHGPGLASLPAMDRHMIANMGAELGATTMDVNPTSRQILAELTSMGGTLSLIQSGARIHQAGCLGCIGMGQAPAIGRNSLRTAPRNFPGRSGTDEDSVWLCSPETAAAAALTGQITDPCDLPAALGIGYPTVDLPPSSGNGASANGASGDSGSQGGASRDGVALLEPPPPARDARQTELVKAPSIGALPDPGPPSPVPAAGRHGAARRADTVDPGSPCRLIYY